MHPQTTLLWWSLGILNSKRYALLKEHVGDLDTAMNALTPAMLRELGLRSDTVKSVYAHIDAFDPAQLLEEMHQRNVQLLFIEDDDYPAPLREIGDPPVFLSYSGDLSILHHPLLAVVGTRGMSSYGKRVAEAFIPSFVHAGVITVSGLALGIDSVVAGNTMHAGGRTVAVLGHGLSTIYPNANVQLANKIVEKGGLLLSEYPLHHQADMYTFPARNRIIAGLSLGTLVIEAPADSGAIITADLALEYNRDVFAVPGQIFDKQMAGCHELIAKGHAKLVTAPKEVLQDIGVIAPEHASVGYLPQNEDEHSVYRSLTTMPQAMDDLMRLTGLLASRVGPALTMMELAGAAKNVGGGLWVRS